MNNNGCLVLLLNKWKPSFHGSHSLVFPPPNNPLPIHTALSNKVFSTSYPNAVDLVKLDLVSMQMSSFTLEGVKSSSNDDPLSYYDGFYSIFYYAWASLPNYSSPKWNQQNLIFQFAVCKFLEYCTVTPQSFDCLENTHDNYGVFLCTPQIFQLLQSAPTSS